MSMRFELDFAKRDNWVAAYILIYQNSIIVKSIRNLFLLYEHQRLWERIRHLCMFVKQDICVTTCIFFFKITVNEILADFFIVLCPTILFGTSNPNILVACSGLRMAWS